MRGTSVCGGPGQVGHQAGSRFPDVVSRPQNAGAPVVLVGPSGAPPVHYPAFDAGPITKIVLPKGSCRSKVRAPHASSCGGRLMVTRAFHSR